MEELRDIKKEVTQRWLVALEFLKRNNIIKSYGRFAEETGIERQRINNFKAFINKGMRPSYAHTDHIVLMHEKFNVSLKFLLLGTGPVVLESRIKHDKEVTFIEHPETFNEFPHEFDYNAMARTIKNNEAMINKLNQKIDNIEKKVMG